MVDRAVLTLALGPAIYRQMAFDLARSFRLWNADAGIDFVLATDFAGPFPRDLGWVRRVEVGARQYGSAFSPKLHLDRITPARETLFIDADSLIVGPLAPVFDRFAATDVGVVGRMIADGEFFGDVGALCARFGVEAIPHFVGGVYFLRAGAACERIFSAARALEPRYDEIGLVRLRGFANEEPLLAIAMAMHGAQPLPDDGTIKADAMYFPTGLAIDVFAGTARFRNERVDARPLIAHFNASWAERCPYTRETLRLRKVVRDKWPLGLATFYAALARTLPERVVASVKNLLRPAYHYFFGPRRIRKEPRLAS